MTRWWPRSMLGRNLMLLVPLTLLSQAFAAVIWWNLVQKPRFEYAAAIFASQILLADRFLSALSPADRHEQLVEMNGVPTAQLPDEVLHAKKPDGFPPSYFSERLLAGLPAAIQVRWQHRRLWVRLRSSDELWLQFPSAGDDGSFGLWGMFFILLSFAAFPTFGAWLIHRRVEGPLKRLAQAAGEIERGHWPPKVPVQGSLELVAVTEAFNQMMSTLAESTAAREQMLAGISHDIRTPLTKLRMVIASPDSFDAPAASADRFIEEIDAIVGQFIDFARGSETEAASAGDLNELVEQLIGDFAGLGHGFELDAQPLPVFPYRQISVQRVLVNLMQNAVLHAQQGLVVRTRAGDGFAVVSVEDRGAGIPQESMAQIRQPFRRGARSTGKGAGLGLAIADRIAREHGGSLELAQRRPHGLIVTIRLPLVAQAAAPPLQ